MGRIRTIKPELIATERFAKLPDGTARLFMGLPSLADDAGNCPAGPSYLAGQIFYARPRSPIVIGRMLGELELGRLIDLYKVDGASYLAILGWSEKHAPTHQRIDKPQPSRFPRPTSVRSWNEFPEHSRTDSDSDQYSDRDRDRDPVAVAASASSAAPPAAGGWSPPPGGKAEAEAKRRIAAGEISAADAHLCWAYCEREGIHLKRNSDAIAAKLVAKQRPSNGHDHDDFAAANYREPL